MHANLPSGRAFAATAVLLAHLVIILALLRIDRRARSEQAQEQRTGILYLLSVPQEVPPPPTPARAASHPRRTRVRGPVVPSDTPLIALPAEPPQEPSATRRPNVDWYREAEEAARSAAGGPAPAARPGSGDHPHSPYRECKPQPQFAWNPEPKTVDIAGGLPFVRIGKRCVIGLGFFGCAIGELPKANGQLLEPAREENVPRTSVPAEGDCPS
jgi:hypothetical protein